MNILHIIPGLTCERGGPTAVVQALVRHQIAAGHAVTVLTTDQGLRHGETEAVLDAQARLGRVAVRGPDRLAYAPALRGAVREQVRHCDIVHVHSIFTYPVHVALREALAAGVPVVLRPCGQLNPRCTRKTAWPKRAYLWLYGSIIREACSMWHFTSEREAAESWPHDASRRFILPIGVNVSSQILDRRQARQTVEHCWPQLEGRPFVLFLGRIDPIKRLDLLLPAFLAGAPSSHRLVAAGPDTAGIWRQLADRYLRGAAARRVHWVGMVDGELKAALLAAADLFVLPSEHENFGIAAVEALAAGTPVLLSSGVDLAAETARAGWGEPVPLTVAAWQERLATILAAGDDGRAEERRQWVAEHYSWARISAALMQHYAEIARPTSAGAGRR